MREATTNPGQAHHQPRPGTLIKTCGQRPRLSQFAHQSSTKLMCIGVVRQFEPPLRPRLRKTKPHRAPNSHTSPNESTREHKLRVVVDCFQMFQAFRGATRCSTPAPSGVARAELLHARRIPCFRSNSRAWSQARSMRGCQRELDRTALRSARATRATNSRSIAPLVGRHESRVAAMEARGQSLRSPRRAVISKSNRPCLVDGDDQPDPFAECGGADSVLDRQTHRRTSPAARALPIHRPPRCDKGRPAPSKSLANAGTDLHSPPHSLHRRFAPCGSAAATGHFPR